MTSDNKQPAPVSVAACALQLRSDATEVQLFPAGEFRASDGRPAEVPAWRMDDTAADRVLTQAAKRKTPFIIDYEHQTLLAAQNGQPAPSAARFSRLRWRPDKGLYAVDVAWTKRARGYIESDEYGYISPVFSYDPETGAVLDLYHAALTNDPALDGMDAVTAAASRLAGITIFTEEHNPMNEELSALLGLAKDATPEAAVAAVTRLITEKDESNTAIAALRSQAAAQRTPDPAQFAPVAALKAVQDELAALKASQAAIEVHALVNAGLADGRLLAAMEPWARELGKADVAALRSYLAAATPMIVLRGTQTGGKAPDEADKDGLTSTQRAICKRMGVAEKDYRQHREEAA